MGLSQRRIGDTVAKMKTFIIVPFVMLISSVYLMPNGPPQEKQGQGQGQLQGQGQGQGQGQRQRQIEKRSAKEIDENDDATNDDQSDNFSDHEPNQPPSVNQAGHSVAPPYSQ